MVCFTCNGKGYVRINDHELPCFECLGRGEFPGDGGHALEGPTEAGGPWPAVAEEEHAAARSLIRTGPPMTAKIAAVQIIDRPQPGFV